MSCTTVIRPTTGFVSGSYTIISEKPIPERSHSTVAQAIFALMQAHKDVPEKKGTLTEILSQVKEFTTLSEALQRYERVSQQFQIQSFTKNIPSATV